MLKIRKKLLLSLFTLLFGMICHSQELMVEVPMSTQIAQSSTIVEGKVISKKSFWDLNRQSIYSINTIEVTKVFKGEADSTIELITEGGVVESMAQITTLSLELSIGDMGIFMLHDSNVQFSQDDTTSLNKYESYSALQGLYKYDVFDNKVSNPFKTFNGISPQFYNIVTALTETGFVNKSAFDINPYMDNFTEGRLGGMAIDSYSPTTITAGTKSVLTINGIGFGAAIGTVLFRDANSGGSSYFTALGSQIVNWSDTQIQVEVPSRAGTGTFRVANSIGVFVNTTSSLQITYSEINVTTSSDNAYQTQHVNDGGNGGYIWTMSTTFFINTPANESFIRALDTWRCETGINWDINETFTNTNTTALDNINIVRFDTGTELPDGVLGRNTSYFTGCSGSTEWYVSELDIEFDSGTNWQYGPGSPNVSQYDFETIAVHELGHAHQLAHVINSNAIMHYDIGTGTSNRLLSANDILGARDIQSRSTTNQVCGRGLMTDHSCSLGIDENELDSFISVYPNPAKNEFFIKNNYHSKIDNIELYDMTGRLVKNANFKDSQGLYTLNTSNLSSGVYLININVEGKILTKKMIIE